MMAVRSFASMGCLALAFASLGYSESPPVNPTTPSTGKLPEVTSTTPRPAVKSVFSQDQRQELEALFEDYVKTHPQVVKQALEKLIAAEAAEQERKDKEMAAVLVKTHEAQIFRNAQLPTVGNQTGDRMIAVFVDPYCGYCQESLKDLKKLTEEDGRVKVVVHDVAILGDASELAARALLAAKHLGKYQEFQEALKKVKTPLDAAGLEQLAKQAGLDAKSFVEALKQKDVKEQYDANMKLADALKVDATPTLVHGAEMIRGYLPLAKLKQKLGFVTVQTAPTDQKVSELKEDPKAATP